MVTYEASGDPIQREASEKGVLFRNDLFSVFFNPLTGLLEHFTKEGELLFKLGFGLGTSDWK